MANFDLTEDISLNGKGKAADAAAVAEAINRALFTKVIDTTLTLSGKAADAAVVGRLLANIRLDLNEISKTAADNAIKAVNSNISKLEKNVETLVENCNNQIEKTKEDLSEYVYSQLNNYVLATKYKNEIGKPTGSGTVFSQLGIHTTQISNLSAKIKTIEDVAGGVFTLNIENAEGNNSIIQKADWANINGASGAYSALFGTMNFSQHNDVFIAGHKLMSSADYQTIFGTLNDNTVADAIFMIGNGNQNDGRLNAFTVKNNFSITCIEGAEVYDSNSIAAGRSVKVYSKRGVAIGGGENIIGYDGLQSATSAIKNSVNHDVILGGYRNKILYGSRNVVLGGWDNTIGKNNGEHYIGPDSSIIAGSYNIIESGSSNFVQGVCNTVRGICIAAFGGGKDYNNNSSFGNVVGWTDNKGSFNVTGALVNGQHNYIGINKLGEKNGERIFGSFVNGIDNVVSSAQSFTSGIGLINNLSTLTLIGRYNSSLEDDVLFAIGNGATANNRSLAFQVAGLGSNAVTKTPKIIVNKAIVKEAPIDDSDVVRKLELDNLKDKISEILDINYYTKTYINSMVTKYAASIDPNDTASIVFINAISKSVNYGGQGNVYFGIGHKPNITSTNMPRWNLIAGDSNTLNQNCQFNLLTGRFNTITAFSDSEASQGNIVGGYGNTIQGIFNVVGGSSNILFSSNSAVFGDFNKNKSSCNLIFGAHNTNSTDSYNIIGGAHNVNSGYYNSIFGSKNNNSGAYSALIGWGNTNTNARNHNILIGVKLQNNDKFTAAISDYECQTIIGKFNKYDSTPYKNASGFRLIVGNGASDSARKNALSLTSNGALVLQGSYITNSSADYAEYFEWIDGNINNEDRIGYIVTLNNNLITKATSLTKSYEILGIISGTSSVIGGACQDEWQGIELKDEFGRIIYEEILIPEERDELDNIIITEHYEKVPKQNPNYNPDQQYIPRSERPEWAVVGLLGQILTRDDGTCIPGGYAKSNDEGIATYSDEPTNLRVMERTADNIVRIFLK